MNRRQLIKSLGALAFPLPQTCQQAAEANQLTIGTLDPNARYMVIVRPDEGQDFSDWRKRREITGEIRDCFQFAGIERGNLGVVFLRGYSMDILRVGDASAEADVRPADRSDVDEGKSIWVDWRESGPGDDNNDGLSPDTPLFTTGAAIDKAQSDSGSMVILLGARDYESEA